MAALPQDVVDAVLAHMNADHADESLAIVQVNFAANAVAAEMIGLDTERGVWRAIYSDDSTRDVEVPWGAPVETIDEVRKVVVAIAKAATERVAATHRPEVTAIRHLPEPPEGGWEAAMQRFHEETKARGGSPFGGSPSDAGHAEHSR